MAFLKELLKTAAVAGTAVAATKVAEKVKENNPEGVQDVNGDGKVNLEDYVAEYSKAATELYGDTAEKVKTGVQDMIANAPETAEKVKDSVAEAAEKVKNSAAEVFQNVKEKVTGETEAAEEAVEEAIEGLKEEE